MRSFTVALLVLSACASTAKPATDVGSSGHARFEVYCPRPARDRAASGARHAWGTLYPVGCMFDGAFYSCECDVILPSPYNEAGDVYIGPPRAPTCEWECKSASPAACHDAASFLVRPWLVR